MTFLTIIAWACLIFNVILGALLVQELSANGFVAIANGRKRLSSGGTHMVLLYIGLNIGTSIIAIHGA